MNSQFRIDIDSSDEDESIDDKDKIVNLEKELEFYKGIDKNYDDLLFDFMQLKKKYTQLLLQNRDVLIDTIEHLQIENEKYFQRTKEMKKRILSLENECRTIRQKNAALIIENECLTAQLPQERKITISVEDCETQTKESRPSLFSHISIEPSSAEKSVSFESKKF